MGEIKLIMTLYDDTEDKGRVWEKYLDGKGKRDILGKSLNGGKRKRRTRKKITNLNKAMRGGFKWSRKRSTKKFREPLQRS